MNARDRWLKTLLYGEPDRIPLDPGAGRESTLARWHREGLPEDISESDSITEYAYRCAGGKYPWPAAPEIFPLSERMIPCFEEKVIEQKDRTRIVQDWKGNICEISNDYTVEYLRNGIDFVTRKWIKCPVESRQDWEKIKNLYNPNETGRLPSGIEKQAQRLAQRDYILNVILAGPFWQLREWLGFENLCMMFHDDPAFVQDMIEFWDHFVGDLMSRMFQYVVPDVIVISEDMAYKSFSMIAPEMIRQFLLPTWTRWGQIAHNAGYPVYAIDSDGYIGELIPIWIEAGFQACGPIEVAAGCDLVKFQKDFQQNMAYWGGVDKRAIAAGGTILQKEIDRLTPVIRNGGVIPSCDHGVPADVSWEHFLDYTRLLAQVTGWL